MSYIHINNNNQRRLLMILIILIFSSGLCGIENNFEGEWLETVAQARIEFALEFHPKR